TLSSSVRQETQIVHCFGCGNVGHVITFIMEIAGDSFIAANQLLAKQSGIQLPKDPLQKNAQSGESQQLLSAYGWLTKLYHHLLRHTRVGVVGYRYFQERGLTYEVIVVF